MDQQIKIKINETIAPEHWKCEQPNEVAKNNAFKVYCFLYETFNLSPIKISATIEEGIYFRYNLDKTKSLIIEILNVGFIVWLINDMINRKVINSGEFKNFEEMSTSFKIGDFK